MSVFTVIALDGAEEAVANFLQTQQAQKLRDGVWVLKINANIDDLLTMLIGFKGEQGEVAIFEVEQGTGTAGVSMSAFSNWSFTKK